MNSNKYYEKLTPENAVMLLVDHQAGLIPLVGNIAPAELKNNVLALAKIAKIFNLPTILTTSFADGPNGPIAPELPKILPNATIIPRPGQINAWDNPDFVKAVEKTGRKKLIIAGILTDVCVAFPAISAIAAGYDVYVVADASGTLSNITHDASMMRMVQAGAIPINWFAVVAELQADWRRNTAPEMAKLFAEHLPTYGLIVESYNASHPEQKIAV
ncbi:MAG: isochorismatase family protein [Nitrosopumilaceae archaeon]